MVAGMAKKFEAPPVDEVLDAVGPRLRALRTERNLTLGAVSRTTGVSVSTLSRLESGGRKPTLELLLPLARAYQVALDDLVEAPPLADPRIHPRPFDHNGMTMVPLTRQDGGLQAYKLVFPAQWPAAQPEQKVHDGYEWLYVLSGRLRLQLGARDFVLSPGEVVEFDTRVPHAFTNPFPEPVEVLTLFGPQGERMHVRARPRAQTSTTR
jgi:transcriptional regulator with XRE-family HTH domain